MTKKRRNTGAATKWVAVLDDQNILRDIKEVAADQDGIEVPPDCDLMQQKSLFRYVDKTGQFKPVRDRLPASEDALIAVIDAIEAAGLSIAPVAIDWRNVRNKRKGGGND